jgi:hypothetical protein
MLSKGLSISTARPSLSAAARRGRTGEEPVASTTRSARSTRSRHRSRYVGCPASIERTSSWRTSVVARPAAAAAVMAFLVRATR